MLYTIHKTGNNQYRVHWYVTQTGYELDFNSYDTFLEAWNQISKWLNS